MGRLIITLIDKAERGRKSSVMVYVIGSKKDFHFGLHGEQWRRRLLTAIATCHSPQTTDIFGGNADKIRQASIQVVNTHITRGNINNNNKRLS